jgi:hypothetical protein
VHRARVASRYKHKNNSLTLCYKGSLPPDYTPMRALRPRPAASRLAPLLSAGRRSAHRIAAWNRGRGARSASGPAWNWREAPPAGNCAGPPRRAAEPPLTWKLGARARNSVPHARAQKPRGWGVFRGVAPGSFSDSVVAIGLLTRLLGC